MRRLLTVVAIAAVTLTACSGDADDTAGDASDATDASGTDESTSRDTASDEPTPAEEAVTLSINANAVRGGQGDTVAVWLLDDVIPEFERQMADAGTPVAVEFIEGGVPGDEFKTQLALDLSVGEGPDLMAFDQFWVAEFEAAGYLEPLSELVGDAAVQWEGWEQIPEAVQGSFALDDQRYGLPFGTDGRVIFYRTDLFEQAGLPTDWQPQSWQDIRDAAETIAATLPEVTPLQLNAGVSMGEATTLQGYIPLQLGAGGQLYDGGWLPDRDAVREAVRFYDEVYAAGLADADLQLRADGRERSFQQFAEGTMAMLIEGDFFWRAVVAPDTGSFPLSERDELVGFALIPAIEPGAGIRGQDYVSASGGTGYAINPNTEHPEAAWELLSYLGSREAVEAFVALEPRITARTDVNEQAIADDPLLSFVASEVLPLTWYRPGFETYPQVSEAIQQMVENVVADRAEPNAAVETFVSSVEQTVGEDRLAGGS